MSVANDQLSCLPEPLTPAKGFSCSRHTRPWRAATFFQQFHGQLVFVTGAVGIGVDGRDLVLGRRNLVVLRLGQHAQLPQLLIQLPHERGYPGFDGAVIVVVQLLPLGGTGTEQRAAAQLQILALTVYLLVDQEVLLLRAYLRRDMLRLGVAEQPQDTDALPVQHTHRAQQRRFFCPASAHCTNRKWWGYTASRP